MPNEPLIYENTTIVASPAAAAETVVCALHGVANRTATAPINLSGWINVTPHAAATAIVLRVRRAGVAGHLVGTAQTTGLGASAGGGAVLGAQADMASADVSTAVPADGASHTIPCAIAAPPAWMDNASHIIAAGLYQAATVLVEVGAIGTAGQFLRWTGPAVAAQLIPVDAMPGGMNAEPVDTFALAAADLPFDVSTFVQSPTDATASFTAQTTVLRLASDAAASGAGITPADAVADVVDQPGNISGATYVLTAQMTSAGGASTVNGVSLTATTN